MSTILIDRIIVDSTIDLVKGLIVFRLVYPLSIVSVSVPIGKDSSTLLLENRRLIVVIGDLR
jgi:hypothetical protein